MVNNLDTLAVVPSQQTPMNDREAATDSEISETELSAFTGDSYYPRLMMPLLEGKSRHAGFNKWATLFGIQWFFFRKLYLFGLFSVALEILAPAFASLALRMTFGQISFDVIVIAFIVILIVTRLIIGYMANIALCLKASYVIKKIDSLNKDNAAHLRMIKTEGGVSVPALLFIYAAGAFTRMLYLH